MRRSRRPGRRLSPARRRRRGTWGLRSKAGSSGRERQRAVGTISRFLPVAAYGNCTWQARFVLLLRSTLARREAGDKGGNMSLDAFPTACGQTLRALSRYPSRTAFSWPGGSLSYRGAIDLIGRMQGVLTRLALAPGSRVALLTANRADTWCAGVAAQLARLSITWLHPLGSLEDQLFQIEDSDARMLIIDADTFRDRGGDLAAKATNIKTVFTLGPADYGIDLLQAI